MAAMPTELAVTYEFDPRPFRDQVAANIFTRLYMLRRVEATTSTQAIATEAVHAADKLIEELGRVATN